ncbi:MAG: NAD-dependent epimerase/dehydratase family protein [Actinobacteria bacterium]|nr:MAG: NAD-dependent epimerase/dehydratase family protein [Actinomycetota bacterium]
MTAPGRKKVLVAGASGLIGHAAVNEFARRGDWDVVGVSRRTPGDVDGATLLSVDLMDPGACRRVFGAMSDVTHLVYAALYEQPGRLLEGWLEREQMERNDAMLRNLFEPLAAAAANLEHISVLQGLKAYGTHAGFLPPPIPAVERSPRVEHENFYWLQEDYLRGKQATERFSLTIWRPHIVFGADVGNNMNPMAALGAYAVLLREEGRPLDFPWGEPTVFQAVDVELFARALVWAATSSASHNETFNFANGDVFTIREVWPAVADAMGMEVGEDRPASLAAWLPAQRETWAALVDRHGLRAPRNLDAFLGQSAMYCDGLFGQPYGWPLLMSTIKLRQAGFAECVDTELMFRRLLAKMQDDRLLPPVDSTRGALAG